MAPISISSSSRRGRLSAPLGCQSLTKAGKSSRRLHRPRLLTPPLFSALTSSPRRLLTLRRRERRAWPGLCLHAHGTGGQTLLPCLPHGTAHASRHSARIAERTKGAFVNVPNQAVRRKALVNALAGCSSALKKQVTKRNILTRNKIPMSAKEIRKLVSAATAGCSSAASVGVVTDVAE